MNIAAFFDIDGTIYRDSLMDKNFRKLIKHEVIPEEVWHREVKESYDLWKKRRGNYEDYLDMLTKVYVENLIGANMDYLYFLGEKTITDYYDSVYRFSRNRIKFHKNEGHMIFFISGSPNFLVDVLANKYEVTDFRGTFYHVDENNKFNGKIDRMWDSESKNRVVLEFKEKYNVDLSKSYAYGDTIGDYHMLKLVGNPIAINPNSELLDAIQEDRELANKTKVAVERKDLIYILNPDVETYNFIEFAENNNI